MKPCMECMLEMQYGFQGNKGPTHKHFPLQVRCCLRVCWCVRED